MKTKLLLDTRNDKHFVGSTTTDLVLTTGRVVFDLTDGSIKIDGVRLPTQVSTVDYTHEELVREMAQVALRYLVNYFGFVLYYSDI